MIELRSTPNGDSYGKYYLETIDQVYQVTEIVESVHTETDDGDRYYTDVGNRWFYEDEIELVFTT